MDATAADFGGTQRFEIRRRVGAGGMGVVYEAYDRQHQMRVALKTLPQGSPASLYRFKQEFRNLADVTHPNLAALYELFSVDEHWFFTMEYVDGFNYLDYIRFGPNGPATAETSLIPNARDVTTRTPTVQRLMSGLGELFAWEDALITTTGPLEGADRFERLRATTLQLAEAVRALHGAGKLHRDIKPSNVLVSRRGRTVLLDFGLTMSVRKDAEEGRVITGTLAYMSPEQAAAEPLLPASDWYSVGAMLYEALTGQFPFHYSSDLIVAKRTLDPPAPRDIAPQTPADLNDLCHRLLSRYAEERPSAEEIIERLGGRPSGPVSISAGDDIPLIGRRDHMNELRAALASTRAGKPVAMFVHGASGEGKSFLVSRFLEQVEEQQQAVVLTGRCYETESVPYKALDSLVDALGRFLGRKRDIALEVVPRDARLLTRVFPVLREVSALDRAPMRTEDNPSDQELRGRASRALRDLIARLGDRVPVILCIDDLQWGDLDSGGLIAELLRGPDAPVILFIGVYRSEYATTSPILQMLLETPPDRRGAERRFLPIGVLSEVEARVLALELLRTVDAETAALAEIVARESRGIPYFVHELVRFVQSGAKITGSLSLEQVLAGRVAALPDAPRRLLETIAVAGQPIRQSDAYNAAGLVGEDRASTAFLRAEHLI
ncbi:MAG TPA: serine/threonine-protein kinase, partial [Thermoanaerobaculia bacterium]